MQLYKYVYIYIILYIYATISAYVYTFIYYTSTCMTLTHFWCSSQILLPRMGRERNPHFNISWIHFGLSGGSYYRAEAVLDAFAPQNVKKIDFAAMEKKVP